MPLPLGSTPAPISEGSLERDSWLSEGASPKAASNFSLKTSVPASATTTAATTSPVGGTGGTAGTAPNKLAAGGGGEEEDDDETEDDVSMPEDLTNLPPEV